MEGNVCGVNHLDSDALLPPRKRLLACLKKQNSDVNVNANANVNEISDLKYVPSNCNSLDQIDTRISYLLKAHLSNDNPSEEEIVAASRAAAEVAVKVAMAARAAAQEKAVIAAKAMAAAKKALELVASGDDEDVSLLAEQEMKKHKAKKQVDVQMLYDSRKPGDENGNGNGKGNGKANDEEIARKLHHAINSSPRILKSGSPSDVKSHKHKKLKTLENGRISNGSIIVGENEKEVENMTKSNMGNGNGSKAKSGDEDVATLGRKRGRMKQKKLPLSICHDKDQAAPKEDVVTSRSPLSVGPSGSERGSLWKCQAFKAPACVKQNKVMQL